MPAEARNFLTRMWFKKQLEEEHSPSGQLITVLDPTDSSSEAYRTLRTSLLYVLVDAPPKVIVLTSPGPEEGKSTTCANLGVVMAQANKRTLIVDCDLRRPSIHDIFGLPRAPGIVDTLGEECTREEAWSEPLPNLKVLTAGLTPPNPTDLLGSARFLEFLDSVQEEFDCVLLDTSPVREFSDAAILAAEGDGAVLVVDAQRTRKVEVRRAAHNLEGFGVNVLGTVINKFGDSRRSRYHGST